MKNSTGDFKIIKVLNNNVLFVLQNNKEKILFERGIGFGKKIDDLISADTHVEKVFSIENENNSNTFKQLVSTVNTNIIGICEEIISMISKELNENLNEKIHISLTDHISFTLKRLLSNDTIQNPFLIETATLYKTEFELAKKAVKMLEEKTNIEIPEDEVGFIALHIHSARKKGELSNTIKYAFLSNTIIEFIEDELDITIDKHSIDYARFITHLRFTIERIINSSPIKNELLNAIKHAYPESYKLSSKICKLLEDELHKKVVEDETAYLVMHIERIKNNTKGSILK
ncbi:transcriptional antiterminator [Clostridium acetobutylicum]|uniref:Transcriptional antiterminator (BglG family) n=1 Tax=Clostridium acetobutylicum (strain ATCC 824 / DSM 792 / JCM 1419 / IAM 19013 / LMG 5710 / NBRC 13948 / NRRL B-527 / VKM B-1787 / 2291 / W) TaxID=272562 RepID=Q97JD1_CLOAB|nr:MULTISPECIES: PRD domain-containing protein [Clostridium]AAK79323.1 Transcriptional antiterminator (BglG family) [Clostridium acetobutylicum ATCC 824]ADZ20406.1 Transcriptional antiterminator (BglG family) [Clostridium acetobutylicum EA 2018]AEI33454.1 BglG family transcriptional antiterminator [Clostridium acetobutylicum DSM 1731]AWV81426.1 PRD domain-containing protein [Clostridium acetobutylicum]MBC2393063.1 PRD domain-containing protein [Clostridium acetobutylicum]